MSTIKRQIDRVTATQIQAAARIPTATLHEAAGKIGALPKEIKPVVPTFAVCGAAVTVQSPGGDNLWLHRALYTAEPGDVLVVEVSGVYDHGYWGEIMSTAAQQRGLAGLVINGCVRDLRLLEQIGLPVFARGLCIRGTGKDHDRLGAVNWPTRIGEVIVAPGDLIVGDADGVVCIPRAAVDATLLAAQQRDEQEAEIIARLARGESTLDIYGWQQG